MRRPALAAVAVLSCAGCFVANTSKPPRYFHPASAAAWDGDRPGPADPEHMPLRLRRFHAAPYLRERIVWRSDVEYGFYEGRRWTEPPTAYVERAFGRELFLRRGLRHGDVGDAATCDVELLAFDEALAPAHEAVVSVQVRLATPDRRVLLEQVFTARRPIAGADPAAVARAMGGALDAAVAEASGGIVAALPGRPRR
ncbi:MAG TPA: ABC-type transport auxiliary lipoprotein family protein [Candidatus Binatia bacterium]|nr:ABC-type transport auxiliary lipoprotein family protein [Candidatus Binatia bacterium]